MKLLDIHYTPRWTTHMGCLKACIDYLELNISDGWLYGGTSHAFILNLSQDLCPSGPTAWKTENIFKLGKKLGYTTEGIFAHKSMPTFKERQRKAFDLVVESIDGGYPCYGWELELPEFYLINGYDESGYIYKDTMGMQKDLKKWDSLGEKGIGITEIYSVHPSEAAKDRDIVIDSFKFALEHARTRKYLFPNYDSGIQGYETWITGLREKTATEGGIAYNAAVWHECRKYAVDFLVEASERLESIEFEKSIECYKTITENLGKVVELYPFDFPPNYETPIADTQKSETAIDYLTEAMSVEGKGLEELDRIIKIL